MAVYRVVDEKFWPSARKKRNIRKQKTTKVVDTHRKKAKKLHERQERPLWKQSAGSVKTLDDIALPD